MRPSATSYAQCLYLTLVITKQLNAARSFLRTSQYQRWSKYSPNVTENNGLFPFFHKTFRLILSRPRIIQSMDFLLSLSKICFNTIFRTTPTAFHMASTSDLPTKPLHASLFSPYTPHPQKSNSLYFITIMKFGRKFVNFRAFCWFL